MTLLVFVVDLDVVVLLVLVLVNVVLFKLIVPVGRPEPFQY